MPTIYSNPRTQAVIENWPSGKQTVTARFSVESHPKRGERVIRVTTGRPKALTYALKVRIVDGDDGRTYIAHLTHFGGISIMRGTMDFQHEIVFPGDARHTELMALFAGAGSTIDGQPI